MKTPLKRGRARIIKENTEACVWTLHDDDDAWSTSCGRYWQFIDGGPADNNAFFCHNCGQKIRINNGTFSNKDTNA